MDTLSDTVYQFDELAVRSLVIEWQTNQRTELLNEILLRSQPIIAGVVFSRSRYLEDIDEILSILQQRICKKLASYDPARRIFTYLTMVVHQGLDDIWSKRRLYASRYVTVDLSVLDHVNHSVCDWTSRAAIFEDICHRILQTQTICTDEHELAAQRWLVICGFLYSEFKLRRHEAADSMTIVYGITRARSRQLHDLTLLEVRRQLLDVMDIPEVEVSDLRGTRAIALAKYAALLVPADFSRLVYLMRNLAPIIIEQGRIDWILDGYPNARLLFA